MNAVIALIVDTWRQSRRQTIFVIMVVILAITAVIGVALPRPYVDDEGRERVGIIFVDSEIPLLEQGWNQTYVTLQMPPEEPLDPFDPEAAEAWQLAMEARIQEAEVATASVPPARKSVEFLLSNIASLIFSISMLCFIAACAGYFPNMLEAGGIDTVLAKPVSRAKIFFGKYLGGLALYAAAIGGIYLILFVGIGARTGIWHFGLFLAMPLQIYAAALLWALMAALGVATRRATLCLVIGYVFYLVIDLVTGGVIGIQRSGFVEHPALDFTADALRYFPNFELMKQNAVGSVIDIPMMEAKPIVVAGLWTALALLAGYWKFRKTDY